MCSVARCFHCNLLMVVNRLGLEWRGEASCCAAPARAQPPHPLTKMSDSEGEGEPANHYSQASQLVDDWSDDEEADEGAAGEEVDNVSATVSATKVAQAHSNLVKSAAETLAAVAVNMHIMDICSNSEDEELAAKAKKVTTWVTFMTNCDPAFPSYPTYKYDAARPVTAHQSPNLPLSLALLLSLAQRLPHQGPKPHLAVRLPLREYQHVGRGCLPRGWHRTAPHRTAPHRTAPHRTGPHRTGPHRTAPHLRAAVLPPFLARARTYYVDLPSLFYRTIRSSSKSLRLRR